MPRYFFDIDDGLNVRDEIGREIGSADFLRREALRMITELSSAEAEDARETALVLTARAEAGTKRLKVRLVCQVEAF